ncbi:MAG: hypothetical protein IJA27_03865 [Lachnospiraceae bacterium]|nr:hypothetical protein [Lachnospiraceae bacterium]
MNIELAFIKSAEYGRVVEMVNERLNGSLKDIRFCSQMDVPDSYDAILANEVKRKVAISSSRNGWIAIIESKEVNDYAMLLQLSKEFQTEVLAVILSDVTGSWGYVEMFEGKVVKNYFSEEDDEIEDLLDEKLDEKEICIPLYMFREVVREKGKGWDIVQISN